MQDIRHTATNILLVLLENAHKNNQQDIVNIIAYELAYRMYIPNKGVNFDDLLKDLGYKDIEKNNIQKNNKTI